jgi:hypothetical protein
MWMPNKNGGECPVGAEGTTADAHKATADAMFENYLAGKLSEELLTLSRRCVSLASAALKLCTELARYWRTVLADQGYRPELHYMRDPGLKWREAHVRLRETR